MESLSSLRPRKIPKQARSRVMFDALLEATARVLKTEGFAAASTNRIAEVAGVSIGSLYQYFGSREALVFTLMERHAEAQTGTLLGVLADLRDAPIEEVARVAIEGLIAAHCIDPELHRVLHEQAGNLGGRGGYMDRLLDTSERALLMLMETRRDELRVKDPRLAAFLIVRAVEAVVHCAVLERTELLASPALVDEMVDLVVRYLAA